MSPYLAEFLGTLLLILLGDGVVAGVVLHKTKIRKCRLVHHCNGMWVWPLPWPFMLWAVISGAHLNPAITLALAASGKFPARPRWQDILAPSLQVLFWGHVLVWVHYLPHWKQTVDSAAKLSVLQCSGHPKHIFQLD